MALRTFKPVTPSLRQLVIVDRSDLYKGKPVKQLTEGKSSSGGAKKTQWPITRAVCGGGHKQLSDHHFKRPQARRSAKVSGSKMIRTGRPYRFYIATPMASCPTLSRRSGFRWR